MSQTLSQSELTHPQVRATLTLHLLYIGLHLQRRGTHAHTALYTSTQEAAEALLHSAAREERSAAETCGQLRDLCCVLSLAPPEALNDARALLISASRASTLAGYSDAEGEVMCDLIALARALTGDDLSRLRERTAELFATLNRVALSAS